MANKNLFKSNRNPSVKTADTVNKAGGIAYDLGAEGGLGQYVVTSTLNGTFYASADEQLDTVLELANKCSAEFVAKAAVYGHRVAKMKDAPALLLAVLANRGAEGLDYLRLAFPLVVRNTKMLRNFMQVIRSGRTGRKSLGTAVKRIVQTWLENQSAEFLFKGSVGNDPSLLDVVKMVHPRPGTAEKAAFYAWLRGAKIEKVGRSYKLRLYNSKGEPTREHKYNDLPALLRSFEDFKSGESKLVPEVDFRMLTALSLTKEQWSEIARNASWNTLRMNLNTFNRHGCFADRELVRHVANRLRDEESVRRSNAFPYQLLTTYQAVENEVPRELSLALQDAMEIATMNVPVLDGETAICVDTSGSMQSPVTGYRSGSTTKTRCVDVAGLIAASFLRKNENTEVVPFDTQVHKIALNPRDSVLTNAQKLARGGGGTDCASALRYLNSMQWKGTNVLFVSDNESWYVPPGLYGTSSMYYGYGFSRGTGVAIEWQKFKQANRKAKLVCLDIQPGRTAQVPDDKDVLNIGGWSDEVFTVVANFFNNDSRDFAKVIRDSVTLEGATDD
jgi:60 kDa SS-A/Ro ribonucleoprotein